MKAAAWILVGLAALGILLWFLAALGNAAGRWYVVQTVKMAGGPSEPDEWDDIRIARTWTRRGANRICREEDLDLSAPWSRGHRAVRVKAWKEEHGAGDRTWPGLRWWRRR